MDNPKFLIDTNILIGLEDAKKVEEIFSSLKRKFDENSIPLFVHEASKEDIGRDKDDERRRITLSKIAKFQTISRTTLTDKTELEALYGPIRKANDQIDVILLHSLDLGAVDFLITQDIGVHKRARNRSDNLADRVFTVATALNWIIQTYEPKIIKLPSIKELKCYQVDINEDIFNSLKQDYPEFEYWYKEKCIGEHRDCWIARQDDEIAAIIIWKDEGLGDHSVNVTGSKCLKLATFKVSTKFIGGKLGELMLKQALWYAVKNTFDRVYLTVYEKHGFLIHLLETYGFKLVDRNDRDECVYAKSFDNPYSSKKGPLAYHLENYPRYVDGANVSKHVIPIQPEFHKKLFPEATLIRQHNWLDSVPKELSKSIPGNTIRKIYLCRSNNKKLKSGDLIFFYMSKGDNFIASQAITVIGVIHKITRTNKPEELIKITAKRSVYSVGDFSKLLEQGGKVMCIDFFIAGNLSSHIGIKELQRHQTLKSSPQSITTITEKSYRQLHPHLKTEF